MRSFSLFIAAIFLAANCAFADTDAASLVDQFKKATDLQQQGLIADIKNKKISARGAVKNVEEYRTFNLNTDTGAPYYRVIAETQNSPSGNPYIVSFFYKVKNEVEGINKGQAIEKTGGLLKIFDERLWVSVWIYTGTIGPEEELFFGDPGAIPPPPVQYPQGT
jgi:flagella basal body P-ring formation protein FlgA